MKTSDGMTIRVNTSQYEFSHGKQPRGYGHWAFEIGAETLFFSGNYGDAKRQAVQAAKDRNVADVRVGS